MKKFVVVIERSDLLSQSSRMSGTPPKGAVVASNDATSRLCPAGAAFLHSSPGTSRCRKD